MTVFKGFMTITRQNLNIVFMYVAIFLAIFIMVEKTGVGESTSTFKMERLEIGVIDRDQSKLSRGLMQYLDQYHTVKTIPDDKAALQDAMFYRNIYYAVIIPEDFETSCLENGEKLPVTKVPGSSNGYYVDQQINTFLNEIRIMTSGGYSLKDAIAEVCALTSETSDITLLVDKDHNGEMPGHAYMYQFFPYILMSILCYAIGYIMISFKKPDLQRRINCSAVSIRSQNLQIILGYIVIGLALWGLCILMSVILYKNSFLQDSNSSYYIVNCFCNMLVSLALAFLVGTLIKKDDLLSAIVNVITLGMSFTCGVFVSLDIMGRGIKTFAHFLPVYWYEVNNQLLAHNTVLHSAQQRSLFVGYLIQILFAAAILCVALVITKCRQTIE